MTDYVADSSPVPRKSRYRRITGPSDVATICEPMVRYRQEVFRALLLNTKNGILKKVTISKGSLNASLVHPRDIFYAAIKANAASIVLVHNHPSGDPEPSREDREFTARIARAGELLGIAILDHVIVGKEGFVSLKERGVI